MVPVIPKSMKVSENAPRSSPGVTKMLPGCGSAWKWPLSNSCVNMLSASAPATADGSIPRSRSAATSLIFTAVTSCRVSTRRVLRSQTTCGARQGTPAPSRRPDAASDAAPNSPLNRSASAASWR